jgi:chromosome segregation ATPase
MSGSSTRRGNVVHFGEWKEGRTVADSGSLDEARREIEEERSRLVVARQTLEEEKAAFDADFEVLEEQRRFLDGQREKARKETEALETSRRELGREREEISRKAVELGRLEAALHEAGQRLEADRRSVQAEMAALLNMAASNSARKS